MKLRRRGAAVAIAALAAGVSSVLPVTASAASPATRSGPVSCQLSWTKATGNRAYPDTSATYWTVKFPVVTGGYLKQDMGPYYPSSAYVATVSKFESLGCPPNLSGLHFG